jgi:hypothetical protein
MRSAVLGEYPLDFADTLLQRLFINVVPADPLEVRAGGGREGLLSFFRKSGYTQGVGDLLDAVWLKLEKFFWQASGVVAAFIVQKKTKVYLLFGLVGVVGLIAVVVVTTATLNKADETVPKTSDLFPVQKVPREEFFVPDEPDFLPPVLLYRAQKDRWTVEDAAPFWTDPAAIDDNWRNKVEEYVEKLLESVP